MKIILICLTIILTSLFYFPFEFTFLLGINTKLIMAGVGAIFMAYHMIILKGIYLSKEIYISSAISILFSLACWISLDLNNSNDYAYATYILSMWVWLLASYSICTIISLVHKALSFKLVANYLIAVCVMQCFLAMAIEFVPSFKSFVDAYTTIGATEFLNEVDRLYGIGAALDVAGVRFSVVLVIIAVLIALDPQVSSDRKYLYYYVFGFLIISGIGNMISRTTSLGMVLGVVYIIYKSNLLNLYLKKSNVALWKVLISSGIVIYFIAFFLYNNNKEFHELIRFGFEGFFNWVEKGEWTTDSTDKLNTEMWIWPDATDYRTWIIGKGLFSVWSDVGTDIGYCRFIFYCGLQGLLVFCLFFIYLTFALGKKFVKYKDLFFLFLIIVFVNWIKVSTDIFLIYAVFLSMGSPYLYSRYYKI